MEKFTQALLTKNGFAVAFSSAEVDTTSSVSDNPDLIDPYRDDSDVIEEAKR